MIVNVRMGDGRTTFQFVSRGDLSRALQGDPGGSKDYVRAFVSWAPDASEWKPIRVTHLRRQSIAFVVNAKDMAESDEQLPAKAERDARHDRWSQDQNGENGQPEIGPPDLPDRIRAALAEESSTADELAARLHVEPRAVFAAVDALNSVGDIENRSDGFVLTAQGART